MKPTLRTTELKDLPELARFLARVYSFQPSDLHVDQPHLKWKYLYPRSGWEGSRSYLLERSGEIVAHGGICPAFFQLPASQIVRSLTILDWAADPTSIGSGLMIYRKLMELAPTSFMIGGALVTQKMVPRIGFRHVGAAPTYAAWLRPLKEFRMRPFTQRSTLRFIHGLTHTTPIRRSLDKVWEFAEVNNFDDTVEPLLLAPNRPWTFCQRTIQDLNYLLKCPRLHMRGFLLKKAGVIVGYFILGRLDWETRVLDLALDSNDADDWRNACIATTNAAKLDSEACRIRVLSTVPMLSQALTSIGYWQQTAEPIMIYDPANKLDGAAPISFQLADGDSGY